MESWTVPSSTASGRQVEGQPRAVPPGREPGHKRGELQREPASQGQTEPGEQTAGGVRLN